MNLESVQFEYNCIYCVPQHAAATEKVRWYPVLIGQTTNEPCVFEA